MNWADALIISIIVAFGVAGFFKGFIQQFYDVITLLIAFFVSVKFYVTFSIFLASKFSLSPNFAKVGAFLLIWVSIQFILNFAFHFIYPKIPDWIRKSWLNRGAGAIPGILWGMIFVAISLTLIAVFPIKNQQKETITGSQTGKWFIAKSQLLEKYASGVFGGAINDTLTFLTVKPNSGETINLGFSTQKVSVDAQSEEQMLEKVNKERTSRGLRPLVMDEKLRELARAQSKDMFARGYFAHVNPDGKDPFKRMEEAGIVYAVAGENLALAPNVDLAHEGLMNSPGHRANILTAEFGKVGIGVIDGGPYGKMFSQEFTD
jgi:uncharacterized protein YkwD